MPINQADFDAFNALVSTSDGYKEKECTPYLQDATDLLLLQTPESAVILTLEQRSFFGRSDFIVAGDLRTGTGPIERYVYFWELKAPQCYLMEMDDNNNRYRPTKDLVKAETQLIHYVHQAARDQDFLERMNVRYSANVLIGGIIIGQDSHIVKPGIGVDVDAANHSFKIRRSMLYDNAKIKLFTWDRILEYVRPRAATPIIG